jgi:hypothetical protein
LQGFPAPTALQPYDRFRRPYYGAGIDLSVQVKTDGNTGTKIQKSKIPPAMPAP